MKTQTKVTKRDLIEYLDYHIEENRRDMDHYSKEENYPLYNYFNGKYMAFVQMKEAIMPNKLSEG